MNDWGAWAGANALEVVVDVAIAVTLAEALWFAARGRGLGLPLRGGLANIAAGLALMLALRSAVRGEAALAAVAWLALAGAAHGADMALRLRAARGQP